MHGSFVSQKVFDRDYGCVVEEKRVLRECVGLQNLAREEWHVIQLAKLETGLFNTLFFFFSLMI